MPGHREANDVLRRDLDALSIELLAKLLDNMADSYAWAGIDFTTAGISVADGERVGYGFAASIVNSGAMQQATDPTGGGAKLETGSTSAGEISIKTRPAWEAQHSPVYRTKFKTAAKNAATDVQAAGFWVGGDARDADTTANTKACVRQETTGELLFVTSDGATEQTTNLSTWHTPGNEVAVTIQSRDKGVTWELHLDGVLRASHATTVPATTTTMEASIGIQNNTTTNVVIDNLDYVYVRQARD